MPRFTEWCPELEAALAEPFPKELHAQKGGKGTFVSVPHYVARLNELVGVGGWSMPAPIPYHSGDKLGLAIGVTVLGVTKWNVGDEMEDHGEPDEDGKVRDFGSSSTNSWAQGFKRACAYGLSLGLYLYDKEFTKRYLAGRAPAAASNGGNTPSVDQLQLIERLQKSHLITDAEREKLKRALAKTNTREQARITIDWLTEQIKRRKVEEGAQPEEEAGVRG